MSILKVARLGHPVLREVAEDVRPSDIRRGVYNQLIDDMFETMYEYQGVGLAGPQVHLPLRVFVWEMSEEVAARRSANGSGRGIVFNGVFEPVGSERIVDFEGCLSVPFLAGQVARHAAIRVRGLDEKGAPLDTEIRGYVARIFQHEIDHTDGHVYLDRMDGLTSLRYTIVL